MSKRDIYSTRYDYAVKSPKVPFYKKVIVTPDQIRAFRKTWNQLTYKQQKELYSAFLGQSIVGGAAVGGVGVLGGLGGFTGVMAEELALFAEVISFLHLAVQQGSSIPTIKHTIEKYRMNLASEQRKKLRKLV